MMEIDEDSRLGLEVLRDGPRYSAHDLPSEESMADFYETGAVSDWNLPATPNTKSPTGPNPASSRGTT